MVSFPFTELMDCNTLFPADCLSPQRPPWSASKSKATFKSIIDAVCPPLLDTKLNSTFIGVLTSKREYNPPLKLVLSIFLISFEFF